MFVVERRHVRNNWLDARRLSIRPLVTWSYCFQTFDKLNQRWRTLYTYPIYQHILGSISSHINVRWDSGC